MTLIRQNIKKALENVNTTLDALSYAEYAVRTNLENNRAYLKKILEVDEFMLSSEKVLLYLDDLQNKIDQVTEITEQLRTAKK